MSSQKMPPAGVSRLVREEEALTLRTRGYTYREIGEQLGVSKVRAFKIVTAAIARHGKTCDELADQIRAIEMARLDRMQLALDGNNSPAAIQTKLRIMERRARYKGLDAPTKTEVFGKDGVPLVPPVINIGFDSGGPGDADPDPGAPGPESP